MKKELIILLISVSASVFAQSTTSWPDIYRQDLEDICQLLKAHHPGYVDTLNPSFKNGVTKSFDRAVADMQFVSDYTSYRMYLKRFVNAFKDRHLLLYYKKGQSPQMQSAGIYPKYMDGRFVIDSVDHVSYPDLNIQQAQIIRVDGVPVDSFFIKKHLEFDGIKDILADWYYNAPRLLTRYKVPSQVVPGQMEVMTPKGPETIGLKWSDISEEAIQTIQKQFSSNGQSAGFVLRPIADNTIWVSIPTFHQSKRQRAAYQQLLDSLSSYSGLEQLVVDLRGNSGGNSLRGDELAKVIYGDAFVTNTKIRNSNGKYYEYRTSQQNAETLGEYEHEFFTTIADSMISARLKGLELYRYNVQPKLQDEPVEESAKRLAEQVIVITDVMCFSACLSFMDIVRADAHTLHVGLPTGADSQYIENRGEWLSSGFTGLSFSMMVARNSIRQPNQSYLPQFLYPYEMSDTEHLQQWVMQTISNLNN
ncbi:S41 family peptidase [Carboxylicivirga taeanensis]|uniref:S41 family peptidase n=1 Tax=Carboxylicivirga taeanensis TaxID=1416875 RepID=UPI003F6DE16C